MASGKLGFVDIGARGGALAKFAAHGDKFRLVLVEAEPTELKRLRDESQGGALFDVIGTALGHIDGDIELNETVNPYCTSVLKANQEFLGAYEIGRHLQPRIKTTIACSRYATLFGQGGLPVPHMIKVDVQGFEYEVLQGFGATLHQCLAIELETHFYQLYQNQRTIGDLVKFLETYGFVLRKLSNPRSAHLNGDYHFGGDLVEVDATFTKNRTWIKAAPEQTRSDFATVCTVMGVHLYAL